MSIDKETLFYLIGLILIGIPLTLGSYICTTAPCDLSMLVYCLLSSVLIFTYVVLCLAIQG